jgi:hypothetical protein
MFEHVHAQFQEIEVKTSKPQSLPGERITYGRDALRQSVRTRDYLLFNLKGHAGSPSAIAVLPALLQET